MTEIKHGTVLNLTHESKGVVKIGHYPIFIKGALPEEKIEYKIMNERKRFAEGKLVRILKESEDRVTPPCPYYEICGGCQTQHMSDAFEAEFKTQSVKNTLKRELPDIDVRPCVSLSNLYEYRNKSVFHVREENGEMQIGFYKEKSRDIVDVEFCMIQKKISNEILSVLRTLLDKYNISPYNAKSNSGYLRNIVVRSNNDDSEVQVVFVTNSRSTFNKDLVNELVDHVPSITSVVQNVNTRKTNQIYGKESFTIFGDEYIEDTILGYKFRLKHRSFYQVNHEITEKLYRDAIERTEIGSDDVVIDAYCGVGTIGQIASKYAKKVIGIEIVADAIEDAKFNAKMNGIENTEYYVGKSEVVMKELVESGVKPNVVIIDPPRAGTDKDFLDAVLEVNPDKLVYVSCNPATLARDLEYLSESYEINHVTPYNMFGKTYHVEAVVHLDKKNVF